MIHRGVISVSLILLSVAMNGCAFFRLIDNSSPEEVKKFQTSKDDLWNQKKSFERWRAVYQVRYDNMQAELDRVRREADKWRTETVQTNRIDKQTGLAHKTSKIRFNRKIVMVGESKAKQEKKKPAKSTLAKEVQTQTPLVDLKKIAF